MEDGGINIMSISLTALEPFCLDVFSGCFVFDGDQFRQPPCENFCRQVLWYGHNRQLSDPCCDAHFTYRNAAVILNLRISLVFGLRCHCRGWSASGGSVNSVFCTQNLSFPTIHTSQTSSTSIGLEPSAVRQSITTLCLYVLYVLHTRHFALLLCWTHVTDWSIDNPGGSGQCRYPLGRATNPARRHITGRMNRQVLAVAGTIKLAGIKLLISLPRCHTLLKWTDFKDFFLWFSFAVTS